MIEQAYAASTQAIPEGPAKSKGVTLGEQVAAAVIADRATDGAAVPDTYRPITSPGVWVPTTPPITEQFARARPWVLKSASQFRPGPPPQLTSAVYARDYNETKGLGSAVSKARTAEQTAAVAILANAQYRTRMAGGSAPVCDPKGTGACRHARGCSRSSAWRRPTASSPTGMRSSPTTSGGPITAIRNGDLDGNDATERDAGWSPMAPTPLHPEYPSQASILAGVSLGVLEAVLGPNRGRAVHRDRYRRPEADTDLEQPRCHGR